MTVAYPDAGTTGWTAHDVLAASAAWTWFPDDARVVREDLTIIDWPAWSPHGAVVVATRSTRPPSDLLAEARGVARRWGRTHLSWWTTRADRPDMAHLLHEHGAQTIETVDVLARSITTSDRNQTAPGITVRNTPTYDLVRDLDAIDVAVWGQQPMEPARLETELEALRNTNDGTGALRVVASIDGRPVATGGATVAEAPRADLGRVARLWGAGTLPDARGRGAYRAVLGERLRLAASHGATLALVKARVDTSAPILRQLGFARYGTERLMRLPV